MDIDLIFKIAAIGIIVSILNQVLSRSGRDEQATMTTLAGLVVVLMVVAQRISELFNLVKHLFDFFFQNQKTLLKNRSLPNRKVRCESEERQCTFKRQLTRTFL